MFNSNNSPCHFPAGKGTRFATLLIIILVLAGALQAIQPASLPVFVVQTLDGAPVSSASWPQQGHWLLIYVEDHCQHCNTLLGRLLKEEYPQLAGHTIIVAGGMQPAEAKAFKEKFPDLVAATWYADPASNLVSTLKVSGKPVTFGVRDGTLQWSIDGVLSDGKQQRSALSAWCAK